MESCDIFFLIIQKNNKNYPCFIIVIKILVNSQKIQVKWTKLKTFLDMTLLMVEMGWGFLLDKVMKVFLFFLFFFYIFLRRLGGGGGGGGGGGKRYIFKTLLPNLENYYSFYILVLMRQTFKLSSPSLCAFSMFKH